MKANEQTMTNECRSSNDKCRVICDSLHCYITTADLRFNDLTRRRHSFAWHAVASGEGGCFVISTQFKCP
jgi:hypothetical protein